MSTIASIKDFKDFVDKEITVKGWVMNKRSSKSLQFIVLRDGTGMAQCVVSVDAVDEDSWQVADALSQESAVEITGSINADERQIGGYELIANSLSLIGESTDYPVTNKQHGIEFLMNNRHLWLRSKRQWAIMRIRNGIIMSIHNFFQERGFLQMDAPIFTSNACEGTSTLFETEYFDEKAYLTQSGQLYGEAMAMAFGKIYTFGPTFRAEKSKTRRHLTEFWMIEPEMAFHDLDMDMDLAEAMLQRIAKDALENMSTELEILGRDTAPLKAALNDYPRISYTDAVEMLRSDKTKVLLEERIASNKQELTQLKTELAENKKAHGQAKKHEKRRLDAREIEINKRVNQLEEELRNLPGWKESAANFEWGNDFGGSDETVLTWQFDSPIIVHRFPAAIKAFYMKRDPENEKVALGMDVLAPEGYGEIVGGGERATDLEFLESQIKLHDLPRETFDWYLDLRKFGSVPHAGFGLGLERTVVWICGLEHVREAIPFARTTGRLTP